MQMSPELLDRPAHLFLDAPYAQPGLLGYLCITIAVETTCEKNLSPERLEPKDGLLDPREPVTGLQGRDRVGIVQSHVLPAFVIQNSYATRLLDRIEQSANEIKATLK